MTGSILRYLAAPILRQSMRQPLSRPAISPVLPAFQTAFRPVFRPFSSTPIQNATLMQVLRGGVNGRATSRSKYGAKKPKKATVS
ncbi:unnamed protein product [Parascedosporium putredinis]|uniref:Uncharacterized protein n=1 Tax=Parascedosporium putredinis TaxID=1442378 RepID=A0A9P1M885_9PEZI|nr:unnamed protein product [Parascedosporium putredinis]CAI7988451.1 unnamed protein product [Parascedosporium putredinis]